MTVLWAATTRVSVGEKDRDQRLDKIFRAMCRLDGAGVETGYSVQADSREPAANIGPARRSVVLLTAGAGGIPARSGSEEHAGAKVRRGDSRDGAASSGETMNDTF